MAKDYFARAPVEEIASEIEAKFGEYERWLDKSRYRYRIQELYNAYYNFDKKGGFKITKSEDGSVANISINHFKNLVQRIVNLTTQSKLAWTPRSTNSDAASQIQSDFSRGLLEYYNEEKDMNVTLTQSVAMACIMLESFVFAPWDFHAGREVGPDLDEETGQPDFNKPPVREGDQVFKVLSPHDVARSTTVKQTPYYIVREVVNKWDLAASYPEFANDIQNSTVDAKPESRLYTPFDDLFGGVSDDDTTYKYTLLHDKTAAMPSGRVTEICAGKVLSDREMFYKRMPIERMSAGETLQTIAGDSPATSLLAIQQALDSLSSAVLTNNLNNSMQNLWSTVAIEVEAIGQGQNAIISPIKPEALQLTASAKETYNLIDFYVNNQQILSGMNATTRGGADANTKTAGGQALALAQAIQFVDEIQKSYARVAGGVGSILIGNLQKFCPIPRIAYIGGKGRESYVKQFTADDIDAIDRVLVDLGSPLVQSVQGRYPLVQEWVANGQMDPQGAIQFLKTGDLDSIGEDKFKNDLLIREENEMLRKGEVPRVLVTDMHPDHIKHHMAEANDPKYRQDDALMANLLNHVTEHKNAMLTMDPDLAAIMGIPPLPSQQMAMQAGAPPPGAGGPPPGGPAPDQGPPEVQGQNLPNTPQGTPPQVDQAYQQAMANVPPQQGPTE